MTVGEMLRKMSSREISEWIALYNLEQEEQLRSMLEASAREGIK